MSNFDDRDDLSKYISASTVAINKIKGNNAEKT